MLGTELLKKVENKQQIGDPNRLDCFQVSLILQKINLSISW